MGMLLNTIYFDPGLCFSTMQKNCANVWPFIGEVLVPTPKCISMFPRSNQLTKVGVMFANKSLCGRDILTLSSEEGRDPGQTWQ